MNGLRYFQVSTTDGLPSGAWVVLSAARNGLIEISQWPNTLVPDPSVKCRRTDEPTGIALAAGEGPNIEFKVELPDDTASRRKVSRTHRRLSMRSDICFSG